MRGIVAFSPTVAEPDAELGGWSQHACTEVQTTQLGDAIDTEDEPLVYSWLHPKIFQK